MLAGPSLATPRLAAFCPSCNTQTNGFSKKVENHAAMVALHFMHYNFCRIHQTLRVTPAMAAGVTDHAWELDEIVALLEAAEPSAVDVSRNAATA